MNVLLSYYPSSTSQRVIRRKKTIDRDIQIAMQSPPQLAIEKTREITTKEEEIRKTGSIRSLIYKLFGHFHFLLERTGESRMTTK